MPGDRESNEMKLGPVYPLRTKEHELGTLPLQPETQLTNKQVVADLTATAGGGGGEWWEPWGEKGLLKCGHGGGGKSIRWVT